MNAILFGIARHVIGAVGAAAVAKGYVDADTAQAAVGAVATLGAVAWSVWSKRGA